MPRLRRSALIAIALTAVGAALAVPAFLASPLRAADALTPDQKQEVMELVRKTLVENPEILVEAMRALDTKRQSAEAEAAKTLIAAHRDDLIADADDPVLGNPNGDVTLVEFFDYRCGYCKAVFEPLMEVIEEDGNVRFVVKEFPILGPESTLASRWALAAQEQDGYKGFHTAMMRHRGAFTEQALRQLAKGFGLDVAKLEDDAGSPEIDRVIQENLALARTLGINGTPAFVIGDQLIPGAVDKETLKQAIADARAEAKKPG